MNTMIDNPVKEQEWILNPQDRCDSCASEALVQITGLSGDLLFCGHHYNKIMNSPEGYKKMMSFMIELIDERKKLVENKIKNEDYV